MKINNFRGELTNISAKKEPLFANFNATSYFVCGFVSSGLVLAAVILGDFEFECCTQQILEMVVADELGQ